MVNTHPWNSDRPMTKLTPHDYNTLLIIHSGTQIADDDESIFRLRSAGLLGRHQAITEAGKQKVEAIKTAKGQIRKGLPLSRRITHRANDAIRAITKHAELNGIPCYYNDEIVVAGERRELIHAVEDIPAWQLVRRDVKRISRYDANSWSKLEPYAVQRSTLDGSELICLRGVTQPEKFRVQSHYFDYISDQFQSGSWWFAQRFEALVVRLEGKGVGVRQDKILKSNIVALVMPFESEMEFPEL